MADDVEDVVINPGKTDGVVHLMALAWVPWWTVEYAIRGGDWVIAYPTYGKKRLM